MTSRLGGKVAEVGPNERVLSLATIPLVLLIPAATVALSRRLPNAEPMSHAGWELIMGIVGFISVVVLHELVHALAAAVSAKVPWEGVKFGFNRNTGALFCHFLEALTIRNYRTSTIAPLVVLGSITGLVTLMHPSVWLAAVTGLHLAGCLGDVWLLVLLRSYPSHFLAVDFPDRIGCSIYEPAHAETTQQSR